MFLKSCHLSEFTLALRKFLILNVTLLEVKTNLPHRNCPFFFLPLNSPALVVKPITSDKDHTAPVFLTQYDEKVFPLLILTFDFRAP